MSWDNVNDFDFNCYVFVELLILVFTIHCIAWAIICRCSLRILMWGAFNTWCPFWNDFRNCLNYSTLPALLYARLKNGPHEKNPSRNGSDSSTAIRIEDDPLHGWMGWYPPVTASLSICVHFIPRNIPISSEPVSGAPVTLPKMQFVRIYVLRSHLCRMPLLSGIFPSLCFSKQKQKPFLS